MDSLGAEVSSKIRAAIKAKLVEQEVYVDDELPDYIMVMIANHKTGEHMADDLRLFLNENTDGFVEWLVQVLAKLKKVTAEQKAKPKKKAAVAKKTKSPGSAKTTAGKKVKKSPEAKKEKKLKREKKKKVKEKGKAKVKAVGGGKAKKATMDATSKKLLKLAGQGQEDEGDDSGREGEYDPVDELRRRARRSPSYVSRSGSRSPPGPPPRGHRRPSYRSPPPSPPPGRRRNRSPSPYSMRSQLGGDRDLRGVGSGNNGGEYDPVQMVKKAMAMKATKATGAAGTKKQSSGSAGQSLRELEREQRKRKEEFDEIHRKRQELSRALKAGKLSREKIEEINSRKRKSEERATSSSRKSTKLTSRSRGEREDSRGGGGDDERRKQRKRKKSPPAMRMRADDYEKSAKEEKTRLKSTVVSKAAAVEVEYGEDQDEEIENSEPSLEKSDLRHQLKERKRLLEDLRTSGLKVQVTNENYQTAPPAEEQEREGSPSPPPVTEVEVEEMDDDEAYLEDMRRRALESMNRSRRQEPQQQRDRPTPPPPTRRRPLTEKKEKKVIIPLNDDDDDDSSSDESSSSSASSTSSSDEGENGDTIAAAAAPKTESDVTLSEEEGEPSRITAPLGSAKHEDDIIEQPSKKERKKNPTFIVTLDGVEGQKKAADAPPAAATVAPEKMSDASKVMAAFKFKPTTAATPPSKEALAAPSTTPTQVSANGNKSEVIPPRQAPKPTKGNSTTAATSNADEVAPKAKAAEPAKPTAPVIPRKRVAITAPLKKASAAATAVVAPMASVTSTASAASTPSEKPKRARITAPVADKPLSKDNIPLPRVRNTGPPAGTAAAPRTVPVVPAAKSGSGEICRFYPNCNRGGACFYFHPPVRSKPPQQAPSRPIGKGQRPLTGSYKWTSAATRP